MTDDERTGPRPLEEAQAFADARIGALARLIAIVDRLRAADGCPWDREQTVASMAPSLVEEAHEAVQAIEEEDDGATVEEAGDLLLVLALIARIGEDERRFDLESIARAVCDKLIRRHPHVFGDVEVSGAAHALANWEMIKEGERKSKHSDASALAGVPRALPALQRAQRIAQKASSAGFRWTDERGALGKLAEEMGELERELAASERDAMRLEEELGDVLFASAILGEYLGLDAEKALRGASSRFEERFRGMEARVGGSLRGKPLAELLELWRAAKIEARA